MASNYGLVKQRRSRLSYGILTRIVWNEKLHGDKNVVKATMDLFDRDEKCRWVQAIDWLIRQVSLLPFTYIDIPTFQNLRLILHQGQPVPSQIELPIRERSWNINSHDVGLKMVVYACDFNAPTAETLLVDKPKNCQGNHFATTLLDSATNIPTRICVRNRFSWRANGQDLPEKKKQEFLHSILGCLFEYPG
jgi:hypothetical protein